jgi:hypothetical protein
LPFLPFPSFPHWQQMPSFANVRRSPLLPVEALTLPRLQPVGSPQQQHKRTPSLTPSTLFLPHRPAPSPPPPPPRRHKRHRSLFGSFDRGKLDLGKTTEMTDDARGKKVKRGRFWHKLSRSLSFGGAQSGRGKGTVAATTPKPSLVEVRRFHSVLP